MASVEDRPFPPGRYPVVIVGSGPGALQTSYSLKRLGIEHAVLSRDEAPAGMFQRFPIFDRLISWTKLNPPVEPGTREYQWYDWNSLLVDDPADFVGVAEFMDGSSEFPSRPEMERALAAFAERNGLAVRYDCPWTGTRRTDDGFVIETPDGEYLCTVAVFAVGMTEPWKPNVPGIEHVPHYMALKPAREYAGKRLYIMGKATSAFEIADGLLHVASSMVLSSPHGATPSVVQRSLAGVRARYMQPMEDDAIGGRTVTLLDAATDRIERTGNGFRVYLTGTTEPWDLELEFDEAISATGVSAPLLDLPDIGVQTFYRGGRLPAQTPFWESATVPGIYFAGSITQGAHGLRKNTGVGAVHGFRFNARIQAAHIAEKHFGVERKRPVLKEEEVVPFLLREATTAPELWNQRGYLGRALLFDPRRGILDEGIVPLTHFADAEGPDGVAVAVELDEDRKLRPVVYTRRKGRVEEHGLEPNTLLDFTTQSHASQLKPLLNGLL